MNHSLDLLNISEFNFDYYHPKNEFDKIECFMNLLSPVIDFTLEENLSIELADNIQSFEASDLKMMFTIYHKQSSNLSVRITQNQYIYFVMKILYKHFSNYVALREPMYSWIHEILTIMDTVERINKHLQIIEIILRGRSYWDKLENEPIE